jgi:hypothetical protein
MPADTRVWSLADWTRSLSFGARNLSFDPKKSFMLKGLRRFNHKDSPMCACDPIRKRENVGATSGVVSVAPRPVLSKLKVRATTRRKVS